jgi:hypothetical protein
MLAQAIWTLALAILVIFAICATFVVVVHSVADEFGDTAGMIAAWAVLAGSIWLMAWSIRFVIHRWLQYGCG